MTRIVCIADLQGMCLLVKPEMLPKGDMLLIAGDLAGFGDISEFEKTNDWLATLDYKYKIVIAGNHDIDLVEIDGHKIFTNATYLQDEFIEIEGITIYGSPVNDMNELKYNGWVFCMPDYIRTATHKIPKDLDILLTHGGPLGILDKLKRNDRHVGSPHILEAVKAKKPKYHIFGHIHESHGVIKKGKTTFINAALCDEKNAMLKEDGSLMHLPITIDI